LDEIEIRPKISELFERQIAAEDLLKRMLMHAPPNGRVHQLEVCRRGPGKAFIPDRGTLSAFIPGKAAPRPD